MLTTAIIPAYNEGKTIGSVLSVLNGCHLVRQTIVVSDGSDDRTAEVARRYPVKVLELEQNVGKGGAMKAGANETNCEVLLFVDADLVGLHTEHIEALLEPVLSGRTAMSIGVFSEGRRSTDLAQKLAPALSGQRAVRKDLFDQVPNLEHSGYGVEIALTQYAERHNVEIVRVPLPTVSQVMKEEKRGLVEGMRARLKMYWEIVRSLRI